MDGTVSITSLIRLEDTANLGISMIARVEFTLRVLDSKSYEQLAASAPIVLSVSASTTGW